MGDDYISKLTLFYVARSSSSKVGARAFRLPLWLPDVFLRAPSSSKNPVIFTKLAIVWAPLWGDASRTGVKALIVFPMLETRSVVAALCFIFSPRT